MFTTLLDARGHRRPGLVDLDVGRRAYLGLLGCEKPQSGDIGLWFSSENEASSVGMTVC